MTRALLIALALLLTGCEPSIDRGACLQSSTSTVLMPQYMTTCVNGSCSMRLSHFTPMPITTCDRWEFPEGRPSVQP